MRTVVPKKKNEVFFKTFRVNAYLFLWNSAPWYGIVEIWFTEFHCGCTSTETIPSSGRPNQISTPEIFNKTHDIFLNVPKVKVRKITKIILISTERVVNILHARLCVRKLCATLVPRLLTIDQRRIRVTSSEQNLAYFNRNPKDLLHRFVTMDETWIHYYSPESREGSKQWVKPSKSAPKRPETQQSAWGSYG